MAAESPSWQSLLGMGAAIAATLVAGMALGWLADSLFGTVPIFTLVGVALGIVAAVTFAIGKFRTFLKN